MAGEGEGNPNRFFVAVHVGAGFHSPANEKAYRGAMKRACHAAAAVLRKVVFDRSHGVCPLFLGFGDGGCLDAVSAAIQVLEVCNHFLVFFFWLSSNRFLVGEGAREWGKSKGLTMPSSILESDSKKREKKKGRKEGDTCSSPVPRAILRRLASFSPRGETRREMRRNDEKGEQGDALSSRVGRRENEATPRLLAWE
ncbi:hypothetical protein BHM03_00036247 [Ensete ventricosum]|nr:hypothetical protein BHM03_00036247 [Ensete ventricosum]